MRTSFPQILTFSLLCTATSIDAALIGWWKFDESSGNSAADEIHANNGTWVPGAQASPDWEASGFLGGAIDFPGSGDHVNHFAIGGFPQLDGTPAGMTISVWVRPEGHTGYRGLLMTREVTDNVGGTSTGQNYGLAQDDNHMDGRASGVSVDSVGALSLDTWQHVAWVWDNAAGTQKLYVDGVQSGPTASSGAMPAGLGITSNGQWRIGDDACCSNRTFDGMIDDLAVWDEPLTASAVARIRQNGLNGIAAGESPPTPLLNVGVVINEVHYDPEPKTEFVEYIELHNTGPDDADLSGWRFSDGITMTFPQGTMLAVGEFLLVGEDTAALQAKYGNVAPMIQFAGTLSNEGETLEIRDAANVEIDNVSYRSEFPWPIAPNGEGDSMQLINATLDNDLGGAWRSAPPTPGAPNSVFVANAPPVLRQVGHAPKAPTSMEAATITVKATDHEGVASVDLLYQIVAPGAFIPAFLPLPYGTLTSSPGTPQPPNPAFEDPANWSTIAMVDDGTGGDAVAGDAIYTGVIPAQPNRTLVRYRIEAADAEAASLRVPYPDDHSLNFAYFVYDGVPDYVAGGTTHSASTLTALPVYTMITRNEDREYAYAYSSTGDGGLQIPKGNVTARQVYNWECALVFDGIVYDHVGWRLRQRNDRYAGNGKRSMRFRMNRGHYFRARDEDGKKLPVKWRRFSTSKMSRFGGTNSYGFHETMNSKLWRMVGVECPYFLPAHWRMVDGADEAPDQYNGDFFGLATIVQDINGRLLDERGLPPGNMYKLKDGVFDPLVLQRNQSRTAVTDGSDFGNIMDNLDSSQSDGWLRDHVDWDQWNRYHAVVEAVRHYDYGTPSTHLKNRAWYFMEAAGTPHGLLRLVPHDHDASWAKGYHDNLNNVGNSIGTGFPWAAIFDDITRPPSGAEKAELTCEYRNFVREFRQLLWQEETVETMIDDHLAMLEAFALADMDRWTGGPAAAGVEAMTAIGNVAASMKSMGFVSDTMYGSNLAGGRAAFLDQIAADAAIPDKPTIGYAGPAGFPVGGLVLNSSAFSDPQGAGTFGMMEWRIAEVGAGGGGGGVTLIANGDTWRYLDDGSDQGAAWTELAFDDAAWASGPGQFGFGEGDEATPLNTSPKPLTSYFRKTLNVPDPSSYATLSISAIRDDGIAVYVNGVEVLRDNLDAGAGYLTPAQSSLAGAAESVPAAGSFAAALLQAGDNVIAVEVHNRTANGSDLSFDLELTAMPATPDRKFEWDPDWESGEITTFQDVITPPAVATRAGRNYRARVRHADNSGRWSPWSEPLEFTVSEPDISLFTSSLVISEIMYHPADPTAAEIAAGYDDDDFFEYVEVRNVGTQTLDLSDVRFTKGVDFDFADGAITSIAPGAYVLVVEHASAFEMRYGAGLPVAGTWSGKLDNGGEQLKLSFGAGDPIRDFEYDDVAPWPSSPDGSGFSLVLIDPFGMPDHGDPLNWRASVAAGGTPGGTDGTTFQGGELLGYATDNVSPVVEILPDGNVAFTVSINQLAEDLVGEVEVSSDLATWQSAADPVRSSARPTANGFASTTYISVVPPSDLRFFVRYRVNLR